MDLYSRQKARHSLFNTIRFRAVSQVATVLAYMVLVRSMKEQAFGVYNLFYSFIPIITTVASFGLEATLRRFQPELLREGRSGASGWLLRRVATMRLATSIAMIGIVLLAWNVIAPRFNVTAYRIDFAIFGVLAILYLQSIILQLSFASHMLHGYSVGSVAAISTTRLLSYLGMAYFAGLTLRTALIADIIANLIGCVVLVVAGARLSQDGPPSPVAPAERVRMRRYGMFNYMNDASSLLVFSQTDNFFVGGLMTPVAVATYAFYGKLTDMVNNLVPQRLFDNIIQPLLFAVPSADADNRLRRYFTLLIDLNLALQVPVIAFALVYHADIVQVFFAGKYQQYSALLPLVLALSVVPTSLSVPISLVAQYHERTGLLLASELFGLFQVAAMLVLIPLLGLYGAALSTGLFNALRNAWIWWRLRGHIRWLNYKGMTVTILVLWGAVVLACGSLRRLTPQLPAIGQLAVGLIICTLAGLVFLRSPGICATDREILGNVMHGRESRALRWLGLAPRVRATAREP